MRHPARTEQERLAGDSGRGAAPHEGAVRQSHLRPHPGRAAAAVRQPMRLVLILALSSLWMVRSGFTAAPPPDADPVRDGQAIAQRLRQAGPEKSASFDGWMTITRPDRTNLLRIHSRLEVTSSNWLIRYVAGTNPPLETLTIVHTPGRPNLYYSNAGPGTNALNPAPLTSRELFRPFAGSDFWPVDLGLDFLSWPTQRVTDYNQMRRGQVCR